MDLAIENGPRPSATLVGCACTPPCSGKSIIRRTALSCGSPQESTTSPTVEPPWLRPQRQPAYVTSSHLVPSRPISSHLAPSRAISRPLVLPTSCRTAVMPPHRSDQRATTTDRDSESECDKMSHEDASRQAKL